MADEAPPPLTPPVLMPSVFTMGRNLLESAKDMIAVAASRGAVIAIESKVEQRWNICQGCEFFVEKPNGVLFGNRCTICGCHMKTKVIFEGSKCPKGKW